MAEEREILAALEHPNIARLYDAGVARNGQPYLALEYVAGRPIDEFIKVKQLSIRARLKLFLLAARAVGHAHARLIVHRDLKPSNILVTEDGEVKLLDFGIARLLDGRPSEGGFVEMTARACTPDYASPEQLAGATLGIATDIYSIGVVLHELLTGVRPAHASHAPAASPFQAGGRRLPSDMLSDRSTRRAVRGDLDAIVLRALEERPDDRYATVNALADDIERHLRKQPVLARPDCACYRLSKCLARNTIGFSAAAAVLLATLTGTGLAAWQAHVAMDEKAAALEVRDFLVTLFRDASPYNAGGQALSALEWLKQVKARADRRLDDRPALRVELLNIVGSSLLTLQDTAAAEEVLAQAIHEATSRLGPDHPETLRARVLMTPVHRFQGRTKEMRAELDRLLPILRAQQDRLAEDLVIALKNQAHLNIDEGRYDLAESAAQEAVEVSLRALGDQHPETVAALLMRALTYQYSRDPDVALRATEHAYRTAVDVFRDLPRHPRTIEGRLIYGRALADAGEPMRAVPQLVQAVADAADVFGPSSRMVGFFSLPLSEYQLETGQVFDAVESSRTAVDIIARHTNARSYRYAAAIHQRGVALLGARRASGALPDLVLAAETVGEILPGGHPITRAFQADRALALARAGRHRDAEELLAPLLPQPGAAVDDSHSLALYAIGVAKRLAGDAEGALHVQQEVLQTMRPGRGSAIRRMRALTEAGLALLDVKRPEQAAASLQDALTLSEQLQIEASPDRMDILEGLARVKVSGRSANAG